MHVREGGQGNGPKPQPTKHAATSTSLTMRARSSFDTERPLGAGPAKRRTEGASRAPTRRNRADAGPERRPELERCRAPGTPTTDRSRATWRAPEGKRRTRASHLPPEELEKLPPDDQSSDAHCEPGAAQRLWRQRSEQYVTSVHTFAHFLRQVNSRPHAGHTLRGRSAFLPHLRHRTSLGNSVSFVANACEPARQMHTPTKVTPTHSPDSSRPITMTSSGSSLTY